MLPSAVRCLADCSFDAFRAVLRDALPPGTWVEPDDGEDAAGARARPGDVALRVRCLRRKSIKAVPRLRAKVIAAQVAAAAKAGTAAEGSASWPFTATVGDVLRASVSAVDAAGVRRAWACLERSEALQVFKLKNKFRKAAAEIDDPRQHADDVPEPARQRAVPGARVRADRGRGPGAPRGRAGRGQTGPQAVLRRKDEYFRSELEANVDDMTALQGGVVPPPRGGDHRWRAPGRRRGGYRSACQLAGGAIFFFFSCLRM